ncbi:MAG: filamentous hemagglutinin N-terminal domain-containing protein [Arsenophonus endosymbiont of Dermacentor nuttalli]
MSPVDINGISSNFHEYFNVDKQDIKINNDVKKPAKIIINQVISREKSIIKGNIEILGNTKPYFIIANPNGIDCSDHYSISNANTATLTTNKIITNNDMLSGQSINNTKG